MSGDALVVPGAQFSARVRLGYPVHIAARIMALAGPGEVLVSGAIPPLVLGSRIAFDDRGSHALKGVRDLWPILAVRDASS
jgi:class 3 adenylate cyclase